MKIYSHVKQTHAATQATGQRPSRRLGQSAGPDNCDVDCIHIDAVREARARLPSDQHLRQVAEMLALLSNPTRLKIFAALHAGAVDPPRELCVCDLSVLAEASKSLTSHQLRLLRVAGLVVARRSGKMTYYRLASPSIGLLLYATVYGTIARAENRADGGRRAR